MEHKWKGPSHTEYINVTDFYCDIQDKEQETNLETRKGSLEEAVACTVCLHSVLSV